MNMEQIPQQESGLEVNGQSIQGSPKLTPEEREEMEFVLKSLMSDYEEQKDIVTADIKAEFIGNILQTSLALGHNEPWLEFISEHAKDFRNMIDSHPEIFREFEEDMAKASKKADELVYH